MASEALVVQAIYSFKGTNNDELCFKKGDLITITQKDDGWWEGTLNDKTGWFPSNYVKETKDVPKPIITQQNNQYKSVVLKDLIDSERAHVTELEGLVTNFLQPLEKSGILSNDEYKQLTGNLTEVLEAHQQLLKLIENEEMKPNVDQKVGRLFLNWAPRIKSIHQTYCTLHPKAVCILDKYKDELTKYMESRGAASPGVLVLTSLLSKPFRRLDKYSGMMQELERHVEECHPDRGDTQRSVAIYKEIASTCAATRRQKELELQVLTGPVRGWEGPSLTMLGDIIYMGSVAVGPQHHDRYFVLFPTTLLILSVSHRLSAFIYEGKLPLSGLIVKRLEDSEQYKNAFEISAPMIEKKTAVCQSRDEANHWVELLIKSVPRSSVANINQKILPSQAQFVPQPPPHHLNTRGYSNRTSILSYKVEVNYEPTYPPETYPPAAPYASLTKLFHTLIKRKAIYSKLLKQLLYPEYLNKMNLSLVKIRHHKTECTIMTKGAPCRDSIIKCDSDSDDTDSSSTTTTTSSNGSSSSNNQSKVKRQNAVDSSTSSDSSNPFGYIRYYNPQSGKKYESVIDYGEINNTSSEPSMVVAEENKQKTSIILTSTAKLQLNKQCSEESEASSSFAPRGFDTAFEDLLNLDENATIINNNLQPPYVPTTRQSCPTKLVGNKFNESSLTTIYIPTWSNSDNNITFQSKYCDDVMTTTNNSCSTTTHSSSIELPVNIVPLPDKIVAELLYNFDNSKSESTVIKPPTMFQNSYPDTQKPLSLNLDNVSFKNHSINSDKPLKRRSSIQINPAELTEQDNTKLKRCVSSQYLQMSDNTINSSRQSLCRCCQDNYCHSPRSSDSGMAGSCTLNSPDLANDASCSTQQRCSIDMANLLYRKYNDLTQLAGDRNVISLSEIEARDFNSQCPCVSPFGSTPRTSCQDSVSQNILTGSHESLRTSSITSSSAIQLSRSQQNKSHSKSIITLEPKVVPAPKCIEEWSCGPLQKSKSSGGSSLDNSSSVESEGSTESNNPLIYKSGLYAHWWLKAKIPASVLKGIYEETRTSTTDVTTGKGF